jgi:hypothetical protein
MKNKILGLLAGIMVLAVTTTKAQVSVNLNVGTWSPPAEYADANYYYLPDVNSYYYVPTHQYIYLDGGNWVWRNTLPVRYRDYSINDGYKVAVYRPRPYRYYDYDRVHYAHYRGVKNVIVRDRFYRPRTTVVNRVRYVNRGPGRGPDRHWDRGPRHGFGHDKPGRANGPGHGRGNGPGHGHGHH